LSDAETPSSSIPTPADAEAAAVPLDAKAVRSVIFGLMLAILLAALDQTIVSVALPRMADELHGFELIAWVVSGYLVASTVVTPIYGKLGDLFGRRVMLGTAITLFLTASLACALAQTMPQLVAARVFQGLGGGGLISISQAIIADVVSLRERGRYQGYISGVFAVASVAGPVVGGLLTHYLSWRWCFWINLPLGAAALAASARALKQLRVPGIRRPIDYLGAVLLTLGLTTLLIGITRAGQGIAWNDGENFMLFATAVVLLAAFVFWEGHAREPIVPLTLFKLPAVSLCCTVLFLAYFNLVGMAVLMPLRFQIVGGMSADIAAWRLVPLSLMIPLGAFIAGRLMMVTGRYRPVQISGSALVPLALLGLALVDVHWIIATGLIMAVAGLGVGLQFPTSLVAVQNAVPRQHLGIATAVTAFFRSMGGAIGISILTTVLLATLHASASNGHALPEGGAMLRGMMASALQQLDPATQAAMLERATLAFRKLFLVGAAVAIIPLVASYFVPDRALRSTPT
jgi:EmrB/QacA subfamily drug resistance transporter